MNRPEPQGLSFSSLVNNIENGLIKIPQFQRDFVWTKEKSAQLLDSILKGYPIGTFILWKTKESLRTVRNLGGAELPATPAGDFVQYVLDGQQRLTSLFASVKGLKVEREQRVDDFSEIYIDLNANEDQDIVTIDITDKQQDTILKVVDLLNADLAFLVSYPTRYHTRLSQYKKNIETYAFSTISVQEAPIDVATEIFTRINVSGQPLSVFEIMVAKTFDAAKDFDLAERYDQLRDELEQVNYSTVPEAVILQAVSTIMTKECTKKQILKLDKSKFIDTWPRAVDAIHSAVDYLRGFYRIPVSHLLPYNALIVPFAYFFHHHPDRPTGEGQGYLQDLFWRVSLGGRYSHSLESRVAQDIRRVDQILAGKQPTYDYPVEVSAEFVEQNGWFSTGRSYVKAILCLLAYHEPKSFIDNSIVHISNDWLKRANSRNYHHFFPRAYLAKQNYGDGDINHIANITIVDDFLNKREIRDKRPSVYMGAFQKKNSQLAKAMQTHLIDVDKFGIWDDDYDLFIQKRCQAIAKELQKRVIRQDVDKQGQELTTDDYEEAGFAETAG